MTTFEYKIPDSKLCQKATKLVKKVSPQVLHNHCLRTYFFGQQLGIANQLTFDAELFYLAAVMHDLGLTKTFIGQQRYEIEGADAAKKFVQKQGLKDEQAEIIWDAIALHTSIGIASRKRPEIALVHLGASLDIFGRGVEALSADTVHQIFETYPRLNLSDALTELFIYQIEQKPEVVPFTWLAEVGRCCVHGFRCASYQDLIDHSPFISLKGEAT
ncbi:MAG: HD domain-containing protein [Cyanobacteria bacterium J06634_5]